MTLPDLTPLQAILLLDALEAIAHGVVDQYRDDIDHYWRTAHRDADDCDDPDLPTRAEPAPNMTPASRYDPSPF